MQLVDLALDVDVIRIPSGVPSQVMAQVALVERSGVGISDWAQVAPWTSHTQQAMGVRHLTELLLIKRGAPLFHQRRIAPLFVVVVGRPDVARDSPRGRICRKLGF